MNRYEKERNAIMDTFMNGNRFYIGANYWASHAAIRMWSEWDADAVEKDFAALASHGIRYLRMFLLWPEFQPLRAIYAGGVYEYRMMPGEQPLPDTEAGRAGVSEEACEHFAEFCRLAEKYGMHLLVGLLTGHMSFRNFTPEAFAGKNILTDPTVIKWEIRFVRYFVRRFRDEPSIAAWDLGNECANFGLGGANPDQSYVWTQTITSAIRESDPTRPVVSGLAEYPLDGSGFNVREHGEMVDILTTHPYHIFAATAVDPLHSIRPETDPAFRAALYADLGGKPAFIEEVGSIGYTNNSEKTEAHFLSSMFWSAWAQGSHGVFWWCAFDQGSFDYAPYGWNNYGSDYGYFREDRSEKPVARTAAAFDRFLQTFPYAELPEHTREAVCIVPREQRNAQKMMHNTWLLAKQANLDVTFVHAEDALPDAKLYILPSVESGKPMFLHRLNALLERVRNGAVLYFSLDSTLFRRLPELTGVTVAARSAGGTMKITLDGTEFTFGCPWRYEAESIADTCTVLAENQYGDPVFVCNSYGKGKIYFLSFPLESILAGMPHAFTAEALPYRRFYETFSSAADDRACVSRHPSVLLTEHPISEHRRLVVAVNYDAKPQTAQLVLRDGWQVREVLRGELDGAGMLSVGASDAGILELKDDTEAD